MYILLKGFDFAVAGGFDVPVQDNLADGVGLDIAGAGVFHGDDVAFYGGLDAAVLEGKVCVGLEGAVFQDEVLAVAQGLGSANVAVHQTEVLGIPAQELSLDAGIVHGDVLTFPESILGVQVGVADDHVLGVLEGVVALELEILYLQVVRMHEDVVGVHGFHVLQDGPVTVPEGFLGIRELDILQIGIRDAAEHLGGFDERIEHLAAAGVPQGGAGSFPEDAVSDGEAVALPEGVFPFEFTVFGLYVCALFEGGFSRADGYVFQSQPIPAGVEGTLAFEVLIFD